MAMVVKNNMSAKNTLNQLDKNDKALAKSLKKAASGMKINSAGDDASGYSISERMDTQLRSLNQDDINTQNANSLLKTAEGAVASTLDILKTLKEKAINAANDTNTDADRAVMQKEFNQAVDQIDDNANVTFNSQTLVDGSQNHRVNAPGTVTSLSNENLHEGTKYNALLTSLTDHNDNSLDISTSDIVTISYVKNCKTYTYSQQVKNLRINQLFSNNTIGAADIKLRTPVNNTVGTDEFGQTVTTASGRTAITFQAKHEGVDGQIAGLTITFTDSKGVAKQKANAVFNDFKETVRAQDPSDDNSLVIQTGTKANQSVKVGLSDMRSVALGLRAKDGTVLSIETQVNANAAINVLDNAVQKVLNQQTTIGALGSRMEYTSANLVTASENTQSSESVICDANMAQEMTEYTKNNVLKQAAQSMLAQANQSSSSVLSLLQ